jgi:suppressor of ftsI/bilirubin oxidase
VAGRTARIALDFPHPFHGEPVYLLHCHSLEHEDQGMMINFKVA